MPACLSCLLSQTADDGPAKPSGLQSGWRTADLLYTEELYDLIFDAGEHNNLAHNPGHGEVLTQMQPLLKKRMERTNDPLPKGSIPLPPGGPTADVNAESSKHIKGLDGSQFR